MARPCKLVYDQERAGETGNADSGESLYLSDDGVPLAWLFLFGGRNIWDVGDDVKARGGAVGARNLYETTVETALTRITHAEDALRPMDHAWGWFSPMVLLKRKLQTKPKTGYLRLVAPWTTGLSAAQLEQFKSLPPFLENFVNFYGVNRRSEAAESMRHLEAFCLFTPHGHGHDRKAFGKVKHFKGEANQAMRLAKLMLGDPAGGVNDAFVKGVAKDVEPALAGLLAMDALPPPGSGLIKIRGTKADTSAAAEKQDSGGLLGRIAGIFRRG